MATEKKEEKKKCRHCDILNYPHPSSLVEGGGASPSTLPGGASASGCVLAEGVGEASAMETVLRPPTEEAGMAREGQILEGVVPQPLA